MMKFLSVLTAVDDTVVSKKTLDEVYALVQELMTDVSGLKSRVSILESDISMLQTTLSEKLELLHTDVLDKLDLFLEKLELMPQYIQLEYVLAFLFMLVCFEIMRLVRGWTSFGKSKSKRGGK